MNLLFFKKPSIAGFTLVEMLVTIAIMLIITGGGIAAFMGFNDRQNVQVAVKELQTMLRAAHIKAKTGEGSKDCDLDNATDPVVALRGYVVRNLSPTNIVMERVCVEKDRFGFNDATKEFTTRDQKDLTSGVTISNFDIEFLTLLGGVTISGGSPATITITGSDEHVFEFDVTSSGEITEGGFLE